MANSVAKRREVRVAGIVAAAWTLAQEHGIAGVSLHALARAVGMRQPSLYEYFDSKNALYDTMFAEGNRQLIERLDAVTFSGDARDALKQWLHALAEEVLGRAVTLMRAPGVTEQGDIDCIVAITAGLSDAQISNDPGGDRWLRHLNRLVDLLVDEAIARGANHEH